MADRKTISVKMDMTREVRDLLSDLNKMDGESKTKLKTEVASITMWATQGLIDASYRSPMPAQAAIVAETIRANRDRVPNITIGGSRGRKASGGATAGELVVGNEFGAYPTSKNGAFPNGGRRFPYRTDRKGRGNVGYWIYPTLADMQPTISRRWWDAATNIFRHWQKYG